MNKLILFGALFSFMSFAQDLTLNCLLRHRTPNAITKLKEWSAPATHVSVYYFAEIDQSFQLNDTDIKIYSRYSLNNGHFFIEVRNWKQNQMAYADSYQMHEDAPHMMLRFDPAFLNNASEDESSYEVECVFKKSSQR